MLLRAFFASLIGLTAFFLLGVAVVSHQNNPAQNNPASNIKLSDFESELLSIATALIRAEIDVEVNGDIAAAKGRNFNVDGIRTEYLQKRLDQAKSLRNKLKSANISYQDFQTTLTLQSLEIEGAVATLHAVEETTQFYDLSVMAEGSPEFSGEIINRRFTFEQIDNQWQLVSERELSPMGGPPESSTTH
jgi:hypothetical protein